MKNVLDSEAVVTRWIPAGVLLLLLSAALAGCGSTGVRPSPDGSVAGGVVDSGGVASGGAGASGEMTGSGGGVGSGSGGALPGTGGNGGGTLGSGGATAIGGTTKAGGTGGGASIVSDGGVDVTLARDAGRDVSGDLPATAADATVTCPDHVPKSSVYPYTPERCVLQAAIDGLECPYRVPPECMERYECQCVSSQTPLVPPDSPDCYWQLQKLLCVGDPGGGGAGGTGGTAGATSTGGTVGGAGAGGGAGGSSRATGGTDGGTSSADAGSCGGEYTACGCGCCGGGYPPRRLCYYPALGESFDSIVAADRAAAASPNCAFAGCNLGTQYVCCAAAPPESPGSATYAATGTSTALDRIRVVRTDGDGICTILELATPTTSSTAFRITLPGRWGIERAFRGLCPAGSLIDSAMGGIGSASLQSVAGACALDLHVTLFFGTTTLEAVPLDATGLTITGIVPNCR